MQTNSLESETPVQNMVPTLSRSEALILNILLTRAAETSGRDLLDLGRGQIKKGSVYVQLGRMEDKGLVASRREDTASAPTVIPRRFYLVTELGRQALAALGDLAKPASARNMATPTQAE